MPATVLALSSMETLAVVTATVSSVFSVIGAYNSLYSATSLLAGLAGAAPPCAKGTGSGTVNLASLTSSPSSLFAKTHYP